ncbi:MULTISPECIES: hypothetical protein [unclassified Alishewanella]|uniref:hypothetical protein n=1 Tax=unclassified Alishewanella TaxID=2628974 RepID=UPI004040FB4A
MSTYTAFYQIFKQRTMNPAVVPAFVLNPIGLLILQLFMLFPTICLFIIGYYAVSEGSWVYLLNYLWFAFPYALVFRPTIRNDLIAGFLFAMALIPCMTWLWQVWK